MDSPFKNVQIDVRKRQKSCADGKDMGVRSVGRVEMRGLCGGFAGCGMRVVCGMRGYFG